IIPAETEHGALHDATRTVVQVVATLKLDIAENLAVVGDDVGAFTEVARIVGKLDCNRPLDRAVVCNRCGEEVVVQQINADGLQAGGGIGSEDRDNVAIVGQATAASRPGGRIRNGKQVITVEKFRVTETVSLGIDRASVEESLMIV